MHINPFQCYKISTGLGPLYTHSFSTALALKSAKANKQKFKTLITHPPTTPLWHSTWFFLCKLLLSIQLILTYSWRTARERCQEGSKQWLPTAICHPQELPFLFRGRQCNKSNPEMAREKHKVSKLLVVSFLSFENSSSF